MSDSNFHPHRSASRELPIGLQIGHYTVQGLLARGGMGAIYEIHNERGQRFALKTLLQAEPGGELLARFQREAAALSQLHHPNILRLIEVFPEAPALVLEFIDGETLKDTLLRYQQDGRPGLPLEEALEIAEQLSRALAECHQHGILHRDLKPENILIEASTGRVVLIDFGLAGALETDLHGFSASLTQSQQVLGTFGFMSPEQLDPSSWGALTTATDIYALAATLCVALSGQGPHGEGSALELQAAILTRSAPPLRLRRPDLPKDLDRLLSRCLERDPGLRPDAEAFYEALLALPLARSTGLPSLTLGLGLFVLVLALAASALGVSQLLARVPPQLSIDSYANVTRETSLSLSGKLENWRPDDRLIIDGRALQIEPDGSYSTKVELRDGPQSFDLQLCGRGGEVLASRAIEVTCDRSPPVLSLESFDDLTWRDTIALKGRVNTIRQDPNPTVRLNGGELTVDQNGFFQGTLPLEFGDNAFPIEVLDQAGNRTATTIRVARLHRIEVSPRDPLIQVLTNAPKPTWVAMKAGEYSINLQVGGRWVFEGEGPEKVLIKNDAPALVRQVAGVLELRNLNLQGASSAAKQSSCLVAVEGGTTRLIRCRLQGAAKGLSLMPKTNLTMLECHFSDLDVGLDMNGAEAKGNKISFADMTVGARLSEQSRLWLTDSQLSKCRERAISAEKGSTLLLSTTKISESGTLIVAALSQLQMSDCELTNPSQVGIDLLRCKLGLNLNKISIRGSGPIGLRLNDSQLEARELRIQGLATAIDLSEQSRISLTEPVIRDFSRDGLSLRGRSRANLEDGLIRDGRLAILLADSSRATIARTRFQDMGYCALQAQSGGQAELTSCHVIRCEEGLEARAKSYIKAIGCHFEERKENEADDLEDQGVIEIIEAPE